MLSPSLPFPLSVLRAHSPLKTGPVFVGTRHSPPHSTFCSHLGGTGLNEEKKDGSSDLQREIAAAREEAQQLEAERQRHFLGELSRLEPLKRLERAVWLMHHEQAYGAFGRSMPLSDIDVAHVEQVALEHVRDTISGLEDPAARVDYVRDVLLDLDMIRDYDGIVRAVRERIDRILEHQAGEWAEFVSALQEAAQLARADLEEAEQAWQARTQTGIVGTTTTWQHLARAAVILTQQPNLTSKDAFLEQAHRLQAVLGPDGEDPGSAIWRGVQRLGIAVLERDRLPDHYLRFEGFQQLVFDLIRGRVT